MSIDLGAIALPRSVIAPTSNLFQANHAVTEHFVAILNFHSAAPSSLAGSPIKKTVPPAGLSLRPSLVISFGDASQSGLLGRAISSIGCRLRANTTAPQLLLSHRRRARFTDQALCATAKRVLFKIASERGLAQQNEPKA